MLGAKIKENLSAITDVFHSLSLAYVSQVVHHFSILNLNHVTSFAFAQAKQADTLIGL